MTKREKIMVTLAVMSVIFGIYHFFVEKIF